MATTYTLVSSKKSSYGSPYAYYTFKAVETARTSSTVTISFTCTGKLATSSSFLGTGLVLKAGVYIGGAWKTWTLKSSGTTWSGTTSHSKSASFSISASAGATSLSGIKVRVLRTDSYGNGAELKACTPSTSSISIAGSAKYSITYNANGGTGAPSTGTKTYGTAYTISSTKPTRANETEDDGSVTIYQFDGWKGSDGKTYQPGGSYTTNANLSLTAIWGEKGKYTISYDCGDYSPTVIPNQTKTEGVAITLSNVVPSVPNGGFTFVNWKGSNGTSYSPGASYTTNANLSLTANYSEWSHNLSFNLNGGTASTSFNNIVVKTLTPAIIPEEEPVKDRYEFQYWCTTIDGTGRKFYPGGTYNLVYNGGTIILYAIYASKDIKIYKNGKISSLNFIEDSNQISVDSSGNFFSAGQFKEGKALALSSSSVECAELIEGEI